MTPARTKYALRERLEQERRVTISALDKAAVSDRLHQRARLRVEALEHAAVEALHALDRDPADVTRAIDYLRDGLAFPRKRNPTVAEGGERG